MSEQGPTVFGGRYELHRRIARGGMSDVVLARDQVLDRPVAVKVMFAQFAADPSFVERFRREAQAAANLTHPNIVGVYDWGQEGNTYYIVMEYIDGRSLAEILRSEGRLHPDRVAEIGIDASAALSVAHTAGIVHRDLKGGNLLITQDGQVKVADFGIATAVAEGVQENLTQTGTVMGTASYFSPEQAQGKPVDPRSDLYSLGVVLYEGVTGRTPFVGDTPVAIAYQHVQQAPPTFAELGVQAPDALEAIIMKCLAKDPANRYPSAENLRADLRRFREGIQLNKPPAVVVPTVIHVPAVDATIAIPVTQVPVQSQYTQQHAPVDEFRGYDDTGRRVVYGVVGAIALAIIVIGGILLAQSILSNDPVDETPVAQEVTIPSVVDQTVDDAVAALRRDGFVVDVQTVDNADVAEGIVFSQDPAAFVLLEEGGTVILMVSAGAEPRPVAQVVGSNIDVARADLERQGFVVEVRDAPGSDAAAGEVISQDPLPGVQLRPGETVVLEVSLGPGEVAVPDVQGLSPAQATVALTDEGLRILEAEEESDVIAEGLVIRTEPATGVILEEGDTVTIFISTGLPMAEIPNLFGLEQLAAEQALFNRGLQAVVVEQETVNPGEIGRVLSQAPLAFGEVEQGTPVTIFIGVEPPPTPTPEPTATPTPTPVPEPTATPVPPPVPEP